MTFASESFLRFARALPGIRVSARRSAMVMALACLAVVSAPAFANATASNTAAKAKPRPLLNNEGDGPAFRLKSNALPTPGMPTLDVSRFAFTAPGRIANSRVQPVERGFSFTPSGSADRKALSVGVTTRTLASATPGAQSRAAAAPVDAGLAPSGYGVDLSVGWKGFAINGGVSRLDEGAGAGGKREAVDVGLSYASRDWKTSVQATAERGSPLLTAPFNTGAGPLSERYAVEAGTALAVSPALSVGGSFRYRVAPVNPTPVDASKDDRAVFLGGALAF